MCLCFFLCADECERINDLDCCYARPMGVNRNNLIYVDRIDSRSADRTSKGADFCLLNARSICNKSRIIQNFIADYDFDILAITETWLRGNEYDDYFIHDICPTDYVFHHTPRIDSSGGGVGVILKKHFKVDKEIREKYRTFESIELQLKYTGRLVRLVIVYHPPCGNHTLFFYEFSDYMSLLVTAPGNLLLAGDFNFHVNDSGDRTTIHFLSLQFSHTI